MRNLKLFFIAVFCFVNPVFSASAQVSPVANRESFLLKVERLKELPVNADILERLANTADPFYPPSEDRAPILRSVAVTTKARSTDSDQLILAEVSELIRPTGVMQFGDDVLLLFGERRVKVGDSLVVPYQGHNYRLQVMKADTRAFTLRLNDEIISRRIQ